VNPLGGAGLGVDGATGGLLRFVFDSEVRLGFGVCSAACVGVASSEIGAGSRCAVIKKIPIVESIFKSRFIIFQRTAFNF
jgi:hypothetical protein